MDPLKVHSSTFITFKLFYSRTLTPYNDGFHYHTYIYCILTPLLPPPILSCLILLPALRRLSSLHLIYPGCPHRPEESFLVDFRSNQTDSQDYHWRQQGWRSAQGSCDQGAGRGNVFSGSGRGSLTGGVTLLESCSHCPDNKGWYPSLFLSLLILALATEHMPAQTQNL